MDPRYKAALESLAKLSDAATPGNWEWFGDQTAAASEETFVEWARALYRNTADRQEVMHFLGVMNDTQNRMTVSTGFGAHAATNAAFILASTAYVRGLIEIARERGDIDAGPTQGGGEGNPADQAGLDQGGERQEG